MPCAVFFVSCSEFVRSRRSGPSSSSPACLHGLAPCQLQAAYLTHLYTQTRAPPSSGSPEPAPRKGSGPPRPEAGSPLWASSRYRRHVQACLLSRRSPRCCRPSHHQSKHAPCQLGRGSELIQASGDLNPQMGYEFTPSERRRSVREALVR